MANLRVVGVWLIGACALTGAVAFAANWISTSNTPSNSSDIAKLMKRYQNDGWPTSPDQMKGKAAPDEQNAAYYLETACDDLTAMERDSKGSLDKVFGSTDTPTLTPLNAKEIVPYEPVLMLAERASHCSYLDFKRDFSQGLNTLTPELPSEKFIGYLLIDRAVLEAKAGDEPGSLRDLQTAGRLAGLESEDTDLTACNQSIGIGARVWSVAEQCASLLTSDPVALKSFVDQLQTLHLSAELMPGLRGTAYLDYYRAQVLPYAQAVSRFDYQAQQGMASENIVQPYVEGRLRLWTFVGDRISHLKPGETQLSALERAFDELKTSPGREGLADSDVDIVAQYEDEQSEEQRISKLVAKVQQNQAELRSKRKILKELAARTPVPVEPPKPAKPPGLPGGPPGARPPGVPGSPSAGGD